MHIWIQCECSLNFIIFATLCVCVFACVSSPCHWDPSPGRWLKPVKPKFLTLPLQWPMPRRWRKWKMERCHLRLQREEKRRRQHSKDTKWKWQHYKIDAGGISLTLKEASEHFSTTVDLSKDMTTGNLLLSFQSGYHFASWCWSFIAVQFALLDDIYLHLKHLSACHWVRLHAH